MPCLKRLVIPSFYSLDAEKHLGRRGDIVLWEHNTDVEGVPGTVVDRGFMRSRTGVRLNPPPTEHQRYMGDKGQLFAVQRFEELVALQRAVFGDASTELNVFAVRTGRRDAIIGALSAGTAPVWNDLLLGDEIFVDLCIGVDLGYNDAILVRSYTAWPTVRTDCERVRVGDYRV